jgi:3-oxoacyl-[acyl-carrier protein] reductase
MNVLIIGGSSKLGLEVSNVFVRNNENVFATYKTSPIFIENNKFNAMKLDLTSDPSVKDFIENIMLGELKFDMVVFIAGLLLGNSLKEYSDLEVNTVMNVNFNSQAILLKKLLPFLSQDSQVLMMSSISAERGSYDPIYAASKGAIISFTKSLSSWLAPKTRANALAPGLIEDTSMFFDMSEDRRKHHITNSPTGKLMQATDLANIIFDLSRSHWSHLNGAVLRLNGGTYV